MKDRRHLWRIIRGSICFVSIFLLSLSLTASPADAKRQFIRFGDSNPGGFWFNMVGGLTSLFNKQIPNVIASCICTGGSTDNNRLARSHELDTWLTHSYAAYQNWTGGIGIFEKDPPFKDFRMLCKVYRALPNLVVLADSDIKTLQDIKGKRVCLSSPGSGTYEVWKYTLQPNGLWDKIKHQKISHAGCATALLDGNTDVQAQAACPTAAVIEVEAQRKIRFVQLTDQEIDKAVKANPFFRKDTIPPGIYKSIQTPTPCVSYRVYWVAHKELSADLAYQMLKVTFAPKNKKKVQSIHVMIKQLGPEFDAMVPIGIPLHPGAVKYWKEQGLTVPKELIPPEM